MEGKYGCNRTSEPVAHFISHSQKIKTLYHEKKIE